MTDVVLLAPLVPIVEQVLHEHGLTTARAWDASGSQAGLADAQRTARGVLGSYLTPIDAALIARFPRLEIVSMFGVGYDNVDLAAAIEKRIVVTNTPDVLTEEVADLALGLLLCTVRELSRAERFVRQGQWTKGPFSLTGSLRGKAVGIFGLGRIGKAVAKRCEAFGLPIAYHGRRPQNVPYTYFRSLLELASEVDVLIVTASASAETKNAVGAEVLEALGADGVLINVARGSIVDEPALIRALTTRSIRAAGLDVFATEPRVPEALLALENVVLLPHVGSATVETRNMMGKLAADNVVSWFAGKGPLTPIPETPARPNAR